MADIEKKLNLEEEIIKLKEHALKLEERVQELEENAPEDKITIGLISGDLDNIMASFIIATTAAVYDIAVDMFFIFHSAPSLIDPEKFSNEDFGNPIRPLLPKGATNLPIDKMKKFGITPEMFNEGVKREGGKSLVTLMKDAADLGVKIHVCVLCTKVLGIKEEELIDYPNIEVAGIGTFVELMSESKQCWFM